MAYYTLTLAPAFGARTTTRLEYVSRRVSRLLAGPPRLHRGAILNWECHDGRGDSQAPLASGAPGACEDPRAIRYPREFHVTAVVLARR
jgi:hypothetical protein